MAKTVTINGVKYDIVGAFKHEHHAKERAHVQSTSDLSFTHAPGTIPGKPWVVIKKAEVVDGDFEAPDYFYR